MHYSSETENTDVDSKRSKLKSTVSGTDGKLVDKENEEAGKVSSYKQQILFVISIYALLIKSDKSMITSRERIRYLPVELIILHKK